MNSQKHSFSIDLACDLMGKSIDQVLEQYATLDPQLLTESSLSEDGYKDFERLRREALGPSPVRSDIDDELFFEMYDAHIGFHCRFQLEDYQAFSYVGVNFINNTAVECIVSLGRPANPERYASELEVTKAFLVSLEQVYLNGRIQEESELGTRVYTWKKDDRTVVSLVASPSSGEPKDTNALLSVQVRDTQLHPGGTYFERRYHRARKPVHSVLHVVLHRQDEPLHSAYEGQPARYYLTLLLFVSAIGLGIGGIVSLVSRNSARGALLLISAALCAAVMARLDSKARKAYHEKTTGATAPSISAPRLEISENLYRICRSWIHELAVSFNETLSMGIEYEACFERVMDMLSVPLEDRATIFESALEVNMFGVGNIPYHKLSPVNQFIVTVPGYVFYCLRNKLPANDDLIREAADLMENPIFPRYLQMEIGFPVSQEVKGALSRPGLFGLGKVLDSFSSLRHGKSRKER